jgi:voltage-gated potassium channel
MATTKKDQESRRFGLARNEDAYNRFSTAVDVPLTVITVLWLPVLIIPLITPVHGAVAETFALIDYMVWALFVLEYVIKLYLSPSRSHYFKTHILDLLIVAVPFFRPARAARLVRLGRLSRVAVVLARGIGRAKDVLSHRGLHFVLLAVGMIIFACAGLITVAERTAHGSNIHSFGQGLWWAVTTVTTVGYGDRYPVTPMGQGVAVVLMLVGIGLIGVLTATVASYFVGQDLNRDKTDLDMLRAELHEARTERHNLAQKLDVVQSQLAELLNRA